MKSLIFSFSLFLILTACSFETKSETTVSNNDSSAADQRLVGGAGGAEEPQINNEIRKVDFKNFTYQPYCVGAEDQAESVTVKNGEFSEEKKVDDFVERFYFEIFSVVYGDVNNDKKEDAVVLSVCNTGGTGNFTEGFVYELKNGKPALLTRIPGGDRAHDGLVEARVENGLIIVERNDAGENGGACCPEFIVTSKYRVRGDKLEPAGAETRREIYPTKRVTFARGASKTTQTVTLSQDDDIKRFVVGARAGQTLTVTAAPSDKSKTVEVILFKGEADTNETANKLTAKLKENGDYVIQIRAFTEKPLKVSVSIEIR
jgi:hypothetical protein